MTARSILVMVSDSVPEGIAQSYPERTTGVLLSELDKVVVESKNA